jgi:hypothetical protein
VSDVERSQAEQIQETEDWQKAKSSCADEPAQEEPAKADDSETDA